MAIYIENTLSAAKMNDSLDKARRDRESLRIAHKTKQLLKIFIAAYREGYMERSGIPEDSCDNDLLDIVISKELFLLVIQQQEVQQLMDDLDIPPDRAHLFDVLDADNSGGLAVTELVQGLLKVRGEARRSDIVAALLAVRAAQEMIQSVAQGVQASHESLIARFCQLELLYLGGTLAT